MKKIIVGFSANDTILSKAIRFLTNSKTSHCYIRLDVPEYNESVVFHAQGLCVHYINFETFLAKNRVIEELTIEMTDEEWKAAEYLRVKSCGKPYSFYELAGYIPILIMRKFGIYLDNYFYDKDKAYVCVELVCQILGIDDRCTSTPQDLLDKLRPRAMVL